MKCNICGTKTRINWGDASTIRCEKCLKITKDQVQKSYEIDEINQDAKSNENDHGTLEDIEADAYNRFGKKSLSWQGLGFGIFLLIIANWEFGYRSFLEGIAGHDKTMFIINPLLLAGIWLFRTKLGILFAFILGHIINVILIFIKKV